MGERERSCDSYLEQNSRTTTAGRGLTLNPRYLFTGIISRQSTRGTRRARGSTLGGDSLLESLAFVVNAITSRSCAIRHISRGAVLNVESTSNLRFYSGFERFLAGVRASLPPTSLPPSSISLSLYLCRERPKLSLPTSHCRTKETKI